MSETNIPRIILGSVLYPYFERIPQDHILRRKEDLLKLVERCYEAGARAFLFYLYNEEIVEIANEITASNPEIKPMFLIKFDSLDIITKLLSKLKKKPFILFLSSEISDQRDSDLIQRYRKTLMKYTEHVGIYSREPIGTVSQFITSNGNINYYLIPFNLLGYGVQNRALLEMIVNSSDNNIYFSSNPIADGKLKVRQALEYISSHNIHGILVELEDIEDMLETIKYGRYFLETKDFLQITLEFEDITDVCEYCGIGMERYYPPSKAGGSYFYCPSCGHTKQITEVTYQEEKK